MTNSHVHNHFNKVAMIKKNSSKKLTDSTIDQQLYMQCMLRDDY